MATGTELTTYVRSQTLLDSDDVSDATILSLLNRAIEVVGSRFDWPWLESAGTIATVVGQTEYDWPSGAVKIHSIVETDKRSRLKRITATENWSRYGDDPPTGAARAYFLFGDKIVLVQKPPSIVTLKVKFWKQPTLLATGAASPEWNSQFHEFIGDYAISKLWEREEDLQLAADAMFDFDNGLGDLIAFYNDQASDERMIWGEQPDLYVGSTRANMPWLDGVS